jgi:hypothetical protein
MSTQEIMKAKMDIHQENMEAAVHFSQSELEEVIKNCVDMSCFVSTRRHRACARN